MKPSRDSQDQLALEQWEKLWLDPEWDSVTGYGKQRLEKPEKLLESSVDPDMDTENHEE